MSCDKAERVLRQAADDVESVLQDDLGDAVDVVLDAVLDLRAELESR